MRVWIAIHRLFILWLCVATTSQAAEPLKSSLQTGQQVDNIFEPLNVTGKFAGEPHCLVCENGRAPVAMLFARDLDEPLIKLLVQIDAATAKHHKEGLGSFIVFLNDQPELPKKLSAAAQKHQLKHIVLATFDPAGPEGFAVSKEAAVTVVLYSEHTVRANHAFRQGELTDKQIENVLRSVPKLLDAK